jgi:betaine-homocysteine S-methyltransferase
MERLDQGPVICAEGYVFELERRGYLQAGAFVPEVVLEHPEVVTQLHRDFVHAGPTCVEALTYYAHREKLRVIGPRAGPGADQPPGAGPRQGRWRWKPARSSPATSAIPMSSIPSDPASHKAVRAMFEEQVGWAVDAGVDYIVGETFSWAQEAMIALDVIKQAKQPAVITLAMHKADVTREDWTVADACQRLADAGADVVGLNCIRGPATMMPLLREDPRPREDAPGGPSGAVPDERERAVVPVTARHALALRRRAAGRFP